MKIIEVDEELYQYIASQTRSIGESASDILRRLLSLPVHTSIVNDLIITSAETDQKPKQAINVKEVNIKTTKKQSITAINQIVEKVKLY